MLILTASLNKIKRITQRLHILSLEMTAHVCSFKYFLRETSHSSMKTGKWRPNTLVFKNLWNPRDKKWGPNRMWEEKEQGHAEHGTATSVGPYWNTPIWWKFILQKAHKYKFALFWPLNTNCYMLQYDSHIRISKSLIVTTQFTTPSIIIFISSLINFPEKKHMFLQT